MVSASDCPGYCSPGTHKCLFLHLKHYSRLFRVSTSVTLLPPLPGPLPQNYTSTDTHQPSLAVAWSRKWTNFRMPISWLLSNARIMLLTSEQCKITPGRWLSERNISDPWKQNRMSTLEYNKDHPHLSSLYVQGPYYRLLLISLNSFQGLQCFNFFTASLSVIHTEKVDCHPQMSINE